MPATRTRRTAAKPATTEKAADNTEADASTEKTEDETTTADDSVPDEAGTEETQEGAKQEGEKKGVTIDIELKGKATETAKTKEADEADTVKSEETQGNGEDPPKDADEPPEEADNGEVAKDEGSNDKGDGEENTDETPAEEDLPADQSGDVEENMDEVPAEEENPADQSEDKGDTSMDAETADGGTEPQKEDSAADQDGKPSEAKEKDEKTEDDDSETVPYPESFSRLHQLTVNIGPIKQRDLMSKELHSILNLTWDFEIKFEKKEKKEKTGVKAERLGTVRIPFTVNSPRFLINIAKKLGNLRIDGRDMSVKFPEVFNAAVKDCEEYLNKVNRMNAKQRIRRVELMKRQIIVKNVPEKVEEDTIKSMFPEACNVTMNMETTDDGSQKVRSVLLDFESEAACKDFLASNKDVTIGDCRVKLFWQFEDNRIVRSVTTPTHRAATRARGRGSGVLRARGIGRARATTGTFGSSRGTFASPRGQMGRMNTQVKKGGFGNRGGRSAMPSSSPIASNLSPVRPSRDSFSPGSQKRLGFQARKARGGGNQSFSARSQHQGQASRRPDQHRDGRMNQSMSDRGMGGTQDEDPVAMMNYLKNAMARMEEKMTQRSEVSGNYGYGGGRDDAGGMGGRNRGGANRNRKRKNSMGEQGYGGKRQYQQGDRHQDRGNNYGSDYNRHSGRSSFDNYDNRNSGNYRDGGDSYYDNRDNYSGQQSGNMSQGQGNYYNQGNNRSSTQGSGSYGGYSNW